jgi:hypothetical protein
MMNVAVLLYTIRCNIACAHCSVNAGPGRKKKMSLSRAYELVDGLTTLSNIEFIDISGGEVTLFLNEILQLAGYIRDHGKKVRITTNGFWARSPKRAVSHLQQMKDAGVDDVGLSIDSWHFDHLPPDIATNYVVACRELGIQPLVSCVLPVSAEMVPPGKAPIELREILELYGLGNERATDMETWHAYRENLKGEARAAFDAESLEERLLVNWQSLAAEGRARELADLVPTRSMSESPMQRCSAAGLMPTFDQEGRLFPCCSPWVNHPDHAFGPVDRESLQHAVRFMASSAVMRVMRQYGPKALIVALERRGMQFPQQFAGMCNLCGMLLERLTLTELLVLGHDVLLEAERSDNKVVATHQL